ncbi:MAG: hypothetical protein MJZ09_08470 [Bacteroidales bacterium]|nr:hypothetical protein [Bacteroidales bacterium]
MRKYDTCFFERYAKISLESLLGPDFGCLEVVDRPDLQSHGDHSIGIEVTRAMEESKDAAKDLLKEISGIAQKSDMQHILDNGYGYGLQVGRYIGVKELAYWSTALPLRRILRSKVSKVCGGFYGSYTKMGLFVFCKDALTEEDILKAIKFVMDLQRGYETKYNRLYLSEVDRLNVCNLEDNINDEYRLTVFPVDKESRKEFYLRALREQFENAR